jgi:hypothetical protein
VQICPSSVNSASAPDVIVGHVRCLQRAGGDTSERNAPKEEGEDPYLVENEPVSPWAAMIGAAQALGIATVLYIFATKMDGMLFSVELPDQYTARNVSVTLRTILRGLVYLATFIFAANGIGLAALTVKLLIFGDDQPSEASSKTKIPDNIPKVGLASNPEDVMRAFDEVSDLSRYKKDKKEKS